MKKKQRLGDYQADCLFVLLPSSRNIWNCLSLEAENK